MEGFNEEVFTGLCFFFLSKKITFYFPHAHIYMQKDVHMVDVDFSLVQMLLA